MVKKPWNWPGKCRYVTGTPASFRRCGVFVAFVAQGIGAGGQHIGRRQADQCPGAYRRCPPVMRVGGAVEIVIAKPLDDGVREQDAGLRLAVRGVRHRKIGGRIDQHLARDRGAVAVARRYRDDRGEVAAGAVAADHQPRRVDAELLCVDGDPFRRGDRVIDGGGEFVLGREPVIDGNNDELTFIGQFAAHHVVGIEIADHPAAAVKEHQARREPGCPQLQWRVDARGDRSVRARGSRAAATDLSSGGSGLLTKRACEIELAGFRRRQCLISGTAGFLKRLEHGGGIGIEGNGHDAKTF